jgi:predicted AAA+ superfamily ATPase
VVDECLDGFSKYEAQAYIESMQAAYFIEVEKWQDALDYLVRAKLIYQKVAQYKDSLEAVIYQEKIGQLDTFIRLCCLNLKIASSADKEEKEGK